MTAVKLRKDQRVKILQLHTQKILHVYIAERFGVAPGTVSRIVKEEKETSL